MKNMENNGIIITEEFKNILNIIEKDTHQTIVLSGTRQCGKTTVLEEYKKLENKKNNLVLLIDFQKYYIDSLSQTERAVYVELILCELLLRELINTTYLSQKMEIQKLIFGVKGKTTSFYDYINSAPYNAHIKNLELIPIKGSLISEIVKEIKKSGIKKVILEIDKFDWIGDSSKYYQSELLSYHCIFDKTIVTSDDEDIYKYKDKFLEKGINFVEINYGKSISLTKRIIRERLRQYKYVSINVQKLFKPNIYKYFIESCNGNFEVMFSVLYYINSINEYLTEAELINLICLESNKNKKIYTLIKKKKFYFDN